jgi:hypothetical protein
MRVLEGHSRAVMTFDYSPAHNLLASGGAERDVLLWYLLSLFPLRSCSILSSPFAHLLAGAFSSPLLLSHPLLYYFII